MRYSVALLPDSPPHLDLEFHGVRCRAELYEGRLEGSLRELYGHALRGVLPRPDLVVEIRPGTTVPEHPTDPTLSLIADEIIWGDLRDGQLVLSDGRSTAFVDYARGHARLELTERSFAADYVAAHRLFPIALAELLRARNVYYLHAAAVASADGAVLFAGDSEAGKSTLAYCAMRDGMKFIADDGLLLAFSNDGAPYVEPYYREFALDQSCMTSEDRARSLPSEPMHTGDPRSRLVPDASRCAPRAAVRAVLGLTRTDGPSSISSGSRTELLGELLRQNPFVALHPELAPAHLSALGRLLACTQLGLVQSGPDIVREPGAAWTLLNRWTLVPSA